MPTTLDGYVYTIVGSNAWITGYTGLGGNISIPTSIEGYPVSNIGYAAFENNTTITSLFVPSSITTIGSYAFSNCSNLLAINVDPSNPNYYSSFGVLYDKSQTILISNPAGLTGSFTIPSTVTTILNWAFAYSHISQINIPSSVNSIGIYAFRDCSNLISIYIPSSVTNIDTSAFYNCTSLNSIDVDVGNVNYSSLDGVLYDKLQTKLICYPVGKIGPFTIPDSVNLINTSAFERCTNLTSITMGNNVRTIGDYAFAYCTNLTSVNMSSSVNTIGSYSFAYCSNLENITMGINLHSIGYRGFIDCNKLSEVKFLGDAPGMDIQVFDGAASDLKIYYIYGKSGFSDPWYGYNAEALYTVTYNGNGNTSGSVPSDNNTYKLNESVTVSANTGGLQKSGHVFGGWNTQADGAGIHYEPGEIIIIQNENIVLYVQWPPYTVTYNGNGSDSGTVPVDSNEYENLDNVTVLNNTGSLEKIGYVFKGWNTRSDGSGTHYELGGTFVIGNQSVTLYAQWAPVYKVAYNGNGNNSGTVPVDSNQYESGTNVTVLGNTGLLQKIITLLLGGILKQMVMEYTMNQELAL
ncbi:leucine-rich repeat protein [Clostridium sp. AL.422]|nr:MULTISPECIES: leucine-rich repeat protein [unclassified Clostridium]MDV4151843.1 leucine-rich repeat protein [Clostridium sp. AL.422]